MVVCQVGMLDLIGVCLQSLFSSSMRVHGCDLGGLAATTEAAQHWCMAANQHNAGAFAAKLDNDKQRSRQQACS